MKTFLPSADGALATWATTFGTLISSAPATYSLTQAQADAYDAVRVEYLSMYQLIMDSATRTKPNIILKNQARDELKAMSRQLAKTIEGSATVTDAQKAALGLNIRKTPSPIPVPSVRPGLDIVSVAGRTVNIHLHDSAELSKRNKPEGVKAAYVYTFVGATYPTDPTEWQFQGAYTKPKCEINFPNSVPSGTPVWVCAAWVNPKLEAGPVSVPVMTNLQGGGVSGAANMKIAA